MSREAQLNALNPPGLARRGAVLLKVGQTEEMQEGKVGLSGIILDSLAVGRRRVGSLPVLDLFLKEACDPDDRSRQPASVHQALVVSLAQPHCEERHVLLGTVQLAPPVDDLFVSHESIFRRGSVDPGESGRPEEQVHAEDVRKGSVAVAAVVGLSRVGKPLVDLGQGAAGDDVLCGTHRQALLAECVEEHLDVVQDRSRLAFRKALLAEDLSCIHGNFCLSRFSGEGFARAGAVMFERPIRPQTRTYPRRRGPGR